MLDSGDQLWPHNVSPKNDFLIYIDENGTTPDHWYILLSYTIKQDDLIGKVIYIHRVLYNIWKIYVF